MSPERWQRIEALYHSVLEQKPEERVLFLAKRCTGDVELQREVESLLGANGSALERPAWEGTSDATVTVMAPGPALTNGAQIGPYRIEATLGAGGMGEVFRATDTRLHRTVAIKILPRDKTTDPDRKRRFLHEARAASALNHPNIIMLHDIASDGGVDYLVMEYVAGNSLDKLIPANGLPLDQAIGYAEQIAGALAAAHAAGIVHRDIKPANVMITAENQVKVLDFGLAKLAQSGTGFKAETTLTKTGMAMGTLAYMSPEQARGEEIDPRTDLFSFGALLYELATGRKAFPKPLDWAAPPADPLPRELRRIVFKLIEPDRDLRYQNASEIRADLDRLKHNAEVPQSRVGPRRSKTRWWILATTSAFLVAVASVYFTTRPAKAALTDHDTIVIADFNNKTGDSDFDEILRQGLIVQLEQSPFLSLISDQKIRATLKLMGKPDGTALAGETAREVCERVGSKAVLEGSIASLGSRYVMSLHAEGCANGEMLYNQQTGSPAKEQVLNTLSGMAGKFRARAGESLAAIREHNVPLEEATTPSLEALKAFTAGVTLQSAPQTLRATELDHDFAAAWSLLAIHYSNSGETALSREAATRAYQLRERASGPEKFNIEYSYHRNVTGNLEKAWDSISLWRQTYPRDVKAFSLSAGYAANGTGRFEQALDATDKAIILDPEHLKSYGGRTQILFRLDRFDEAAKAFEIAAAHHAVSADGLAMLYRFASFKQDGAALDKALAQSRGEPEAEMVMTHVQALAAARAGRLDDAERLSRRAVEMARGAGLKERAAVFGAAQAVWNAFYGNREVARLKAETALKAFDGREVDYAAGFALGLAGDGARAEVLAARLDKGHPEDTHVQATYVPTLRALAALGRNDPRTAIDLLEANRSYEFGISPLAFNHLYGNTYPLYVRGLAYLALHRADEAAQEFSRLLAHPGLVMGDPVEALARRQLALALASGGDKSKAATAYQDVLALWKNADPDIAILKLTKAEYGRLRLSESDARC